MKRLGIDVGGTFTDVVVLDEETGTTRCLKTMTVHDRPAEGIMRAFDASGVDGVDVSHVKLGTTLGLNAILTRTGAPTGLLTTAGFRDVLEIRRTHRQRLFDLNEQIPAPLVPRRWRKEVVERIGSDGDVVVELDDESVRKAWRELRAEGVKSVAVAFLFSFRNAMHEQRARDLILDEGGADSIYISSDVLPVLREYERTSTTVAAAYIASTVRTFVSELAGRLEERGVKPGRLAVTTNSGGSVAADVAASAPIPTLLSGPAGGVAGARWLARLAGTDHVLTLDMGGTSCDVSGVQADVPDERLDMSVAGLDIAFPTFDIHTIGAGGGSIAWIDGGGALRVGPASAGSTPGPASYGRGGSRPTVTDANLVLGRYDESKPLGGSLVLSLNAARQAIDEHIATPLGLTVEHAAAGIVRLVNATMVNAVRTISVERGRDSRSYALVPFGGGGPVHASDIARELGISAVVVPPFPGCTSAFGAVMARPRRDSLRTINGDIGTMAATDVSSVVNQLISDVRKFLSEEGYDDDTIDIEVWGNLHYRGQAHELAVRHDGVAVDDASLQRLKRGFVELHEQQYGHSFDDVPVELVTIRVTGYGHSDERPVTWEWNTSGANGRSRRHVYFEELDDFVESDIWDRSALRTGQPVEGPAVVHQADATTLVPPGWQATVHQSGSLLVTKKGPGESHE